MYVMQKYFRPALLLVAMFWLSLTDAQPASAHNRGESISPADGVTLTELPAEWVMSFAQPVPLDSASGEVINGNGVRTDLGTPRQGDSDAAIVFDLPADLSGSVALRWRLVGVDGHIISGRVKFQVQIPTGEAATAGLPVTGESSPESTVPATQLATFTEPFVVPESVHIGLRSLNYIGILLLGGILTSELLLSTGLLSLQLARRQARIGLFVIAITSLLQLGAFVNDSKRPATGWITGLSDSLSTTPGLMLFMKLIVGLLLIAVLEPSIRTNQIKVREQRLVLGVVILYLLALAYGGHSRSQAFPWIGIPTAIAHTAASTIWLGGLLTMIIVIIPNIKIESALSAFRRFGYVAQRAVAVILVTGVVQTVRLHPTFGSLFTSGHGIVLVCKVILVLIMLWLAARNRSLLDERYQLTTTSSRVALIKASLIELVIGTLVIVLTAVLVSSSLA